MFPFRRYTGAGARRLLASVFFACLKARYALLNEAGSPPVFTTSFIASSTCLEPLRAGAVVVRATCGATGGILRNNGFGLSGVFLGAGALPLVSGPFAAFCR